MKLIICKYYNDYNIYKKKRTDKTSWKIFRKPVNEKNLKAQLKCFIGEYICMYTKINLLDCDCALKTRSYDYNIKTKKTSVYRTSPKLKTIEENNKS
jgi:hypothetical protein